ncbi:MAG: toprim domain-containing protein [Thermoplasmatota archaeon]
MLPRTREEVLSAISDWVEKLNGERGKTVVIVEGTKDEVSLINIGVELPVVHLNKGMSILDLMETLKRRDRPFEDLEPFEKVVVLTDWDRTGGRLAYRIKETCRGLGIQCDLEWRKELSRITRKWIRDVESLDSLFK